MTKETLIAKKVLFIDLDGTIIQTASKKTFPVDCCDFIIQKNVLDKIKEVLSNIQYLFIITNQNGIGKFLSLEEFTAKASAIWTFIKIYFGHIKGNLYYCDKNPSFLRKPNVGLLEEALDAYAINSTPKENMDNVKSIHYSSIDKNLLGGYIASIASYYPNFIEDFKEFLDKEVENIDMELKEA